LNIENGGSVSASYVIIGDADRAHGSVTVDGLNSSLTATYDLSIAAGGAATGTLTIQNQATLSTVDASICSAGAPTGNVVVDGLNSRWNNTSGVSVGNDTGGSATLAVRNSGAVTVGGELTVNRYGAVDLQTAGKIHADTIRLAPGATFADSAGTLVRANRLEGFGDVRRFYGNLQLGHAGGGSLGLHTVGSGQSLTVDQYLVVGLDKEADLSVETGGLLESGRAFIAAQEGAGLSDISINGGRWTAADSIFIGGDDFAGRATGAVRVTDGGLLNANGAIKVWPNGLLQIAAGSIINAPTVELAGGSLSGQGALALAGPLNNAGVVSLSGPLSVSGIGSSYQQSSSGALSIDFKNGGEFGRLNATGSATLGGHLTGIFWVGYAPQAWDKFRIFEADELQQTFASESLPAIPGKPGLDWVINYDYVNDFVELQVAPIFAADFDEDGDVDGADLVLWRLGVGTSSGALHSQGDADGDRDVDGADFLTWQRQLGSGSIISAANGPVPEPGSAVLASIAVAIVVRGQVHQRRRK
jgi:T5SS/PEP-CTERM-associated repeat protein